MRRNSQDTLLDSGQYRYTIETERESDLWNETIRPLSYAWSYSTRTIPELSKDKYWYR